ncbi:MAG: TonB-dependent receptor plug domain-containing protein [Fimbriimonadaceae bacterium]|nr:TonB-dependent receptor plug domain-containing protein [Fimbriimonadaceae bacterium]
MLAAILVFTTTAKVETTIPVSVVDVGQIEQLNSTTNVKDIVNLRVQTNLQLTQTGMPIRGLSVNTRPDQLASPFNLRGRVDLNTIPTAAVDRVEVLRDLSTAVYGSDAVAGVVNIMTKADDIFNSLPTDTRINPSASLKPNGWTKLEYGYQPYNVDLSLTYRKEWTTSAGLQFETIGEWKYPIGTYYDPLDKPIASQYFADGQPNKELQQALGGLTVTNKDGESTQIIFPTTKANQYEGFTYAGKLDYLVPSVSIGTFYSDIKRSNPPSVIDKFIESGQYTPAELLAIIGMYAPEGEDMNHLFFPLVEQQQNPCNMDLDAPVGTMWIPTNPAFQTMTTGVSFNRMTFNNLDVFASLNNDPVQSPAQMRVLCMNMEKKEPAAGVKYLPYRCQDPILREITGRMNNSNFRGVWDQARLWIYTDKATMKQINAKLVSPMTDSAFAMALADVGIAGGLEAKQFLDKDLFTPSLLSGSAAPDYAVAWISQNLLKNLPKEVAKWLDTSPEALTRLSASDAEDYEQEHLVKVLEWCLRSASPDVRKAALGFVKKNVTKIPVAKGKVGDLSMSLYSKNEAEVKLALEVMATDMPTTKSKVALEYVAKNGPGDANKAAAKALLAGL